MIAFLMMLAADPSSAFLTGNDLYAECTSSSQVAQVSCLSYITGAADGVRSGMQLHKDKVDSICIPEGVTRGQLKDVVVQSLRDDPVNRNLPAGLLVWGALYHHWHCPAS